MSAKRKSRITKRAIAYLRYAGCSEAVLFGIAKGPWALWWADMQDKKGRSFSGQDIYELAPDPPPAAVEWAEKVSSQLKQLNGVSRLEQLYQEAARAGFSKDPEVFGMYLGCQTTGSGIAWDDDLSGCGDLIKVPYDEFYV